MSTATEDLMTVVTVGSGLRDLMDYSFMFVFTLVKSRTLVDTVQTVLHNLVVLKHICWGHTMKVLGSHVIFVRRHSVRMLSSRGTYFATQVWSHMFARNVRSVSVHLVNWNNINWNILTSNCFPVVHVANISSINTMLCNTLRDVQLDWDIRVFFNPNSNLFTIVLFLCVTVV